MRRTSQPNVLFIISDQHSAYVQGHEGHPDVLTPNLDRLAGEGVRFRNAYCQNPICTPSRISFLSGRYCHDHGYYQLRGREPVGLTSLFSHLGKEGYLTAAIGKIHCPDYWLEKQVDRFLEVNPKCSVGGAPEYTAYLAEHGLLDVADYQKYPEEIPPRSGQSWDGRPSNLPYEHSPEGWAVRRTIEFMDAARARSRPFFAYCSLHLPHENYCPARRFWSWYDNKPLTLPPNADFELAGKSPLMRRSVERCRGGGVFTFEPKTFEAGRLRKLQGYLGGVSQVDHAVGELLGYLDVNGLSENTIVIYSSDHGEYVCQFGCMEKQPHGESDSCCRIPFLWRWPGHFAAGHSASELVESVDLSVTLCNLLSIPPSSDFQGKDISHLLKGGQGEVRRIAVTDQGTVISVRAGPWRLVLFDREKLGQYLRSVAKTPEEQRHLWGYDAEKGHGELYNLETDPWEMNNLYFEDRYRNVIRDIKAELADWHHATRRNWHPRQGERVLF